MGGLYYDRGDRPEFGKTGRRKKYKTPAPQQSYKAPPISLADLQRHSGRLLAPRESNVVHGPTAEERFRRAASARMDEKLAREKTFGGRFQNRREDFHDSVERTKNRFNNFKDRAVGGIANVVGKVKGGANKAWDVAQQVGGGIKRFGQGAYQVGSDAVKLASDLGGGIANAYRGAKKGYKFLKHGIDSAREMAQFMASNAPVEEKVKRGVDTVGAAGELGQKALDKGADIAIGAAKGAYRNYVPEEHKKKVEKVGRGIWGVADKVGGWAEKGAGWLSKYL
jgi:hypothetical protein